MSYLMMLFESQMIFVQLSARKESIVMINLFLGIFLADFSELMNFAEAHPDLRKRFLALILKLANKRRFSRLCWKLA